MSIQTWTWILVGLSFALYFGIAIWARAGSTKEFYIAGGGVSPLANGMATAADWMSAASFISMAGIISFAGYDGSVYLMGWTGGYVLLALLLAPYLRKFGCYTVPDFIGTRYGGNLARFCAIVVLVVASFTYVTAQINATGTVAARAASSAARCAAQKATGCPRRIEAAVAVARRPHARSASLATADRTGCAPVSMIEPPPASSAGEARSSVPAKSTGDASHSRQ